MNALSADLGITKSDSPDPVTVGQELTYTLMVANLGPDTAAGVTVSDTLPPGVTFVSATSTQGTCTGTNASVSCTIGTIAFQGSATVTIKVTPTERQRPHEHRHRLLDDRRPEHGEQHGHGADDGERARGPDVQRPAGDVRRRPRQHVLPGRAGRRRRGRPRRRQLPPDRRRQRPHLPRRRPRRDRLRRRERLRERRRRQQQGEDRKRERRRRHGRRERRDRHGQRHGLRESTPAARTRSRPATSPTR